jgi:hypothetical protein
MWKQYIMHCSNDITMVRLHQCNILPSWEAEFKHQQTEDTNANRSEIPYPY